MTTRNSTIHASLRDHVVGDEFIKPMTLAKVLGIRPQQVYGYVRKGKLESVLEPVTGKILVKVASASSYVEAREARLSTDSETVEA
jgi:hypothetical protein